MTVTNLDSNFMAVNLKLIIRLSSIIHKISQLMFAWIDNQNRKYLTINHTHKTTGNVQGEKSPKIKQKKTFWASSMKWSTNKNSYIMIFLQNPLSNDWVLELPTLTSN